MYTMERSVDRTHADYTLLVCIMVLAVLGVATLYSASYGYALTLGLKPGHFALRQLMYFMPPSIILFVLASFIKISFVRKMAGIIVLLTLVLLALPFVPGIGITKNGAPRWFGFGDLMFQPSELFKPVLVVYLAHILSKKAERLGDIVNAVLPPLIVALAGIGLVLLQNDFSTAVLLILITVVMFWIANVPFLFFAALASLGVPLVSLVVLTSDFRLKRVLGFLAPSYDPADLSYQVNGSLRAIRSGGWFGRGLGQGVLKLRSIPEVQSDFVFAAWVEETGFLGVLIFIAVWVVLLFRVFVSSFRVADPYIQLLLFGMGSYLCMQTLLNIAVVAGAVPATGMPLPFFSSGGSSLLSVALACGFINQGIVQGRTRSAAATEAAGVEYV
ncbi:MAG: putative lipid II flippase FtsW [Spirochaetes bacterium]|nr:putative lipid II flippase FtsW [Spirochaetota bacterium]